MLQNVQQISAICSEKQVFVEKFSYSIFVGLSIIFVLKVSSRVVNCTIMHNPLI
jgi:hypothetical protein